MKNIMFKMNMLFLKCIMLLSPKTVNGCRIHNMDAVTMFDFDVRLFKKISIFGLSSINLNLF